MGEQVEPGLVDASDVPLSELAGLPDSALSASIRGILGELEAAADVVSGWASYLDTEGS